MNEMSLSFSDRIIIPRGVVARAVGESTVLLNSHSGRYFTLDDVGTRAWSLLTSTASIQAAYDTLITEFAAEPDRLADDLEELIGRLNSLGLVEIQRD
jgi:coenzyme PQQ synthesis protein D (PqqD)